MIFALGLIVGDLIAKTEQWSYNQKEHVGFIFCGNEVYYLGLSFMRV